MFDCWPVHTSDAFRSWVATACPGFELMYIPYGRTGDYQINDVYYHKPMKDAQTNAASSWHLFKLRSYRAEVKAGKISNVEMLERMRKLMSLGKLREQSPAWLKRGIEALQVVDPDTNDNILRKGWVRPLCIFVAWELRPDGTEPLHVPLRSSTLLRAPQIGLYFSKMDAAFIIKARADAETHRTLLEAHRLKVATAAMAEVLQARPGDVEAAHAAGEKAAAAVKRLPSDPLDKVARYEESKLAHGVAPPAAKRSAKPGVKRRRRCNPASVAAAAARAAAPIEADLEPRVRPTVEMLKQMLRDRGIKLRGKTKKADLLQLLADSEDAVAAVPDAVGDVPAAPAAAAVHAEAASPEPALAAAVDGAIQPSRKRRRPSRSAHDDEDSEAEAEELAGDADEEKDDEEEEEAVGGEMEPGGDDEQDDDDDDDEEEDDPDEDEEEDDPDEDEGIYFKEERNPQFLVDRLEGHCVHGKLDKPAAVQLVETIRKSLSSIISLCEAYSPPLVARAGRWKELSKRFEAALGHDCVATRAVEISKLVPFKLKV